jgi:curved DNA-binding protein
MEQRDYYTTLGVEKDASSKKVKEAYRKLALQYHPDRNPDPSAASRMKDLNEAYAVLSDAKKRREYDLMREQFGASAAYGRFRQSYSEEDIFRGSDIGQIFEEISRIFGVRSSDEVFRQFYGPGYRTFEFRRPGFSGRAFIYHGHPRARRAAGGPEFQLGGPLGRLLKYTLKKQWGVELPEKGRDIHDTITISPDLARSGGRVRYTYRPDSRDFIVTIPRGIGQGRKIRLRGMGRAGKGGGTPGDLYIAVRVRKPLKETLRDAISTLASKLSGKKRV